MAWKLNLFRFYVLSIPATAQNLAVNLSQRPLFRPKQGVATAH